ncbi:hypothetical protein [Raoultella sp. C349492]|uniref:hypothetical protein n=1 Tax=Raoultella sp. C349492 TaxID=2970253 RepID=UPI0035C6A694
MFVAFLKMMLAGEFLSFDYKINPKKNQRREVFFTHFSRPLPGASFRLDDKPHLLTEK